MKFNDTSPVLPASGGTPLWLARLADNATLEATVLKRPVEGRADILSVIKHASVDFLYVASAQIRGQRQTFADLNTYQICMY